MSPAARTTWRVLGLSGLVLIACFGAGALVKSVDDHGGRIERIEDRQRQSDDRLADIAGDVKAVRVTIDYVKRGVDELRDTKTAKVALTEPTTRPTDE